MDADMGSSVVPEFIIFSFKQTHYARSMAIESFLAHVEIDKSVKLCQRT
jgi:hypothetical protein